MVRCGWARINAPYTGASRFQYWGQREKLKVVGAGGVLVILAEVAEKHAREIVDLLEFGSRALGDVDAESIAVHLVRLCDDGRSKETRKRHLAILTALLSKVQWVGCTPINAAREVRTKRAGQKKLRPYCEEELI